MIDEKEAAHDAHGTTGGVASAPHVQHGVGGQKGGCKSEEADAKPSVWDELCCFDRLSVNRCFLCLNRGRKRIFLESR